MREASASLGPAAESPSHSVAAAEMLLPPIPPSRTFKTTPTSGRAGFSRRAKVFGEEFCRCWCKNEKLEETTSTKSLGRDTGITPSPRVNQKDTKNYTPPDVCCLFPLSSIAPRKLAIHRGRSNLELCHVIGNRSGSLDYTGHYRTRLALGRLFCLVCLLWTGR